MLSNDAIILDRPTCMSIGVGQKWVSRGPRPAHTLSYHLGPAQVLGRPKGLRHDHTDHSLHPLFFPPLVNGAADSFNSERDNCHPKKKKYSWQSAFFTNTLSRLWDGLTRDH
jgi:hypothetical protein